MGVLPATGVPSLYMTILLSTLNARYAHASLGLRYLLANMGPLQAQTLAAGVRDRRKTVEVVEEACLAQQPRIIGFGVYIWNVEESTRVVALLKRSRRRSTWCWAGRKSASKARTAAIVQLADYVVTGWGDVAFPALCRQLLHGPSR